MARADATIAGGGPAGLAAAIALAERGAQVLVLEPRGVVTQPRAEMLPAAAEPIVARLGASGIYRRSVTLGPALSLWSGAWPEVLGHGMELTPNAKSVDRGLLETVMRARATELGVTVRALRLRRVAGRAGDWQVEADGTDGAVDIRTRFLVDATGRPAALARRLGARLRLGPDLVARTLHIAAGMNPRLVVEATPGGWWYGLPLHGGGGTLGFVSAPGTALEPPTLLPIVIAAFLARAASWDARMTRLSPMGSDGWLAVGDAAAAFDPIAAQGLFNALSGGFFAGNAAADVLAGHVDAPALLIALAERTAARTHMATPWHYRSAHRDTPFWRRLAWKNDALGPISSADDRLFEGRRNSHPFPQGAGA
jgi:flavin-dependent dehydrogenase